MTSLHHDRRVDDGQAAAPAAPAETLAPARGATRRRAGTVDGTVTPRVPSQRQGKASRGGADTDRPAAERPAKRSSAKAVTAAGSLAAKAKAATTAAAKAKAAAKPGASSAAKAKAKAKAKATVTVSEPVAVEEHAPTPFPRPRAEDPAETPAAQPEAPVAAPAQPAFAVVPAFVDETLAGLQNDPAGVVPALAEVRRAGAGRHRAPVVRRRPAFYLAAGLVGALSLGALADTDPAARAETTTVAETVSVAEQLGLDGGQAAVTPDAEPTRLLQELVASRNERDAESTAAADAQAAADVQAVMAAAEAFRLAAEAARPKVVAPINGARLTSGFGARWGTVHAGIDLAAPMRTPEYAVMDGVVLEAGAASGYGLVVYIRHDNGDVTVYGHMDEILVEPGQVVRAGDTIALLGNRGQSTGPHLHFEVIRGGMNGTKVDPIPWLRERGVNL